MLENLSDFFKEKFRIICETIIGNSSDNLKKNFNKTEKSPGNHSQHFRKHTFKN